MRWHDNLGCALGRAKPWLQAAGPEDEPDLPEPHLSFHRERRDPRRVLRRQGADV